MKRPPEPNPPVDERVSPRDSLAPPAAATSAPPLPPFAPRGTATRTGLRGIGALLGGLLIFMLFVPFADLIASASVPEIAHGFRHPLFLPALLLSLRTSLITLALTVLTGTAVAWWLATSPTRLARAAESLISVPIVMPPAVVGVALLQTFGQQGPFAPLLNAAGIQVVFTQKAVVLAQTVVSAPFFVQAAANAFRKVDIDTLIVARTLGASPISAFLRVAVPVALPGLLGGASLAWARALGEFGATLLFAGNMTGTTQTMPLAIYTALQSNVRLAVVFSLVLGALGAFLLLAMRALAAWWQHHPVSSPRPQPQEKSP